MSESLLEADRDENRPLAKSAGTAAVGPSRHRWLLGAVIGLLGFGAGWMVAGGKLKPAAREALPGATGLTDRSRDTVVVTIEPVTLRPVQRSVEGVGTLHGFEEIVISTRVEGRVRRLGFEVADRVKPGDLLLEIDPTDSELAVEQAERALQVELARLGLDALPGRDVDLSKVPSVMQAQTRLEHAQSKFDRIRSLAATRAISAEESDAARSDLRSAQAEYAHQMLLAKAALATIRLKQTALAVAQQQLTETQLRAPTPTRQVPGADEGVTYAVTRRAVSEGTLVRPGTEVGRLVINQTLKLRVPIPERHSSEVQPGQKVDVMTGAIAQPYLGTVTRINPAVDPTTRTFEVEIQVLNPGGELKPGSFAKATIQTRFDAEAVTVPLSAVVSFAGINKVFLFDNGRAKELPIRLGVESTEWVEIAAPALPRGMQVITSGQTALSSDAPVAVRASGNCGGTGERGERVEQN
jgi:RND family efflux transporter MFP subunit